MSIINSIRSYTENIDEREEEGRSWVSHQLNDSQRDFLQEDTKQKALEWADASKSSVATELEELDPPKEKLSYRSEYKKMMESFVDVYDSLVDSITEIKMNVTINSIHYSMPL